MTTIVSATFTSDAQARFIRFDLGGNWDDPTFLDLSGDGSSSVDLGFEIDFGLGAVSSMTVHEDGFVTFGAGEQITIFDDLGFDFVSVIPPTTEDETPGALSYSQGVFDLDGTFGVDPTDTFRLSWFDPLADAALQLLITTDDLLNPGNFMMQFNYGCDPTRAVPCDVLSMGGASSSAGLELGDNSFTMSGPFTADRDYDFRFAGGVLVDTPAMVPAPETLGILLLGLPLLLRRQRAKSIQLAG
ncbi:MAG: hypothetical protein AAGC91_08015 [Pseudomonadota bacterium]